MSIIPNFFIIGAQKAGTTNLYYLLKQHPDIYFPEMKEPGYFYWTRYPEGVRWPNGKVIKGGVSDWQEYLQLYANAANAMVIGDASTIYLYDTESANAIKNAVPHAKIVAVVRDPVARAYSAYNFMRRNGKEPISTFDAALALEPERIAGGLAPNLHYVNRGLYGQQLRAWYGAFPREQIRIVLFEDLVGDPLSVCAELFTFLGVDSSFVPDLKSAEGIHKNASGIPTGSINAKLRSWIWGSTPVSAFMKKLLPFQLRAWVRISARRVIGSRGLRKPEALSSTSRQRLRDKYRDDIRTLESLMGAQLPGWMVDMDDLEKPRGNA